MIQPTFATRFSQKTGINWRRKYTLKVIEKLNRSNFDLHWIARKSDKTYSILFKYILKGNYQMVAEFLKKYSGNERIIDCVDP